MSTDGAGRARLGRLLTKRIEPIISFVCTAAQVPLIGSPAALQAPAGHVQVDDGRMRVAEKAKNVGVQERQIPKTPPGEQAPGHLPSVSNRSPPVPRVSPSPCPAPRSPRRIRGFEAVGSGHGGRHHR